MSVRTQRMVYARRIAIIVVVGIAAFVRLYRLDAPLMWCDEAESSINALTILSHGYPGDHYLGQPIYENCLVEPWPEHPEYEFRDSSYSKNGMAIYHGWLPLYLMAGSFKLFGIEPDVNDGATSAKLTDTEIRRRTIAARLPSALCGMLFLWALYHLGREAYGRDAAWAALATAAIAMPIVKATRQARYYSLTLTLCTACCLFTWRIYTRGRWRDFILGGICFALLFHTHILTFVIASLALAGLLPLIIRRHRQHQFSWSKISARFAAFGGIVAALVLPWIIATDFLTSLGQLPAARNLIHYPQDVLMFPLARWPVSAMLLGGMIWLMVARIFRGRLPERFTQPFARRGVAFAFLAGWCVVGYVAFVMLIPAASLFFQRAYLGILGPGLIFGAMLFAASARVIGGRTSIGLACMLYAAFVVANVSRVPAWTWTHPWQVGLRPMITQLQQMQFRPGTRIYTTPSDNLTLSFYTGLPIQSIAPVRKTFLDNYPGDILFIETIPRLGTIDRHVLRTRAADAGVQMTPDESYYWASQASMAGVASQIRPHVASVRPDPADVPTYVQPLLEQQVEQTRQALQYLADPTGTNPAIFRGYSMTDYTDWWQIFFYRFVDLENRTGPNTNYMQRLRHAQATVQPSLWVMYHSPPSSTQSARTDPEEP